MVFFKHMIQCLVFMPVALRWQETKKFIAYTIEQIIKIGKFILQRLLVHFLLDLLF
jgi:hypothetical protein